MKPNVLLFADTPASRPVFVYQIFLLIIFSLGLNSKLVSQVQFTVNDAALMCGDSIIEVSVEISNFDNITEFHYFMSWDPSVLAFENTFGYNLTALSGSSFGTSNVSTGSLAVDWISPGVPVSAPNGQIIYRVQFFVLTPFNLPKDVSIIDAIAFDINGSIGVNTIPGTVSIIDNTPPTVISCQADIEINATMDCHAIVEWITPFFEEDCSSFTISSNFNSGDQFPIGSTLVEYTAVNTSGLSGTCSFNVMVSDLSGNSIACVNNITIKIPPGQNEVMVGGLTPILNSNCSTETYSHVLSGATTGTGAGDASGSDFNLGTTTVTYTTNTSMLSCFTIVDVLSTDCVLCDSLINEYPFDTISPAWIATGCFVWDNDGEAQGTYWGNRKAIGSKSGGGAMMVNSDTDTTGSLTTFFANDFSQYNEVYLTFTQYYRNFESSTSVEVFGDTNNDKVADTWVEVFNNNTVSKNIETSHRSQPRLDISYLVANTTGVNVRFLYAGNRYFWIIDDIEFHACFPYPETFPEYLADTLITCCVPYDVDEGGAPFVTNEIVIEWDPNTSEDEKIPLRDSFGVVSFTTCCDYLELWTVADTAIATDTMPSSDGTGSIGVKAKGMGANASSKIRDAECNFYQWNELNCCEDPIAGLQLPHSDSLPPFDPAQKVIAVLDTGIDWFHDSLKDFLWKNPNPGGISCMDNGFPGDTIGWNFVDYSNKPYDDHCPGHGTHVSGIVVKNLKLHSDLTGCGYRIMPVKICDERGLSTLFRATCGTYYAVDNGAHVINDSWGMYNVESTILGAAMDYAETQKVLVVTAAGNDEINMDLADKQYPASYQKDNIITVASVDTIDPAVNPLSFDFSDFSNFGASVVHIGAPGDNILSTVPINGMATKTGTSMSAPAVTAAVAIGYHCENDDMNAIKNKVLHNKNGTPWINTNIITSIDQGRILTYDIYNNCSCLIIPATENPNVAISNLPAEIYPNPTSHYLMVEPKVSGHLDWEISIYNIFGQKLMQLKEAYISEGQPIKMDINHLSTGTYFIHIQQEDEHWAGKLIKQ